MAIAWVFLALGLAWQHRHTPARRLVRAAADASFGVYLAHPLLLQGLLTLSAGTGLSALAGRSPRPLVTIASMIIVVPLLYLTSAILAEAARRTPLSLPLTGRTRRVSQPWRAPPHEPDGQSVPAPITAVATSGGM
jgi:peptidoglycan/LPS O-acetylase OafA/YrhL